MKKYTQEIVSLTEFHVPVFQSNGPNEFQPLIKTRPLRNGSKTKQSKSKYSKTLRTHLTTINQTEVLKYTLYCSPKDCLLVHVIRLYLFYLAGADDF